MDTRPVYLVSACLVGLCTRYDGRTKTDARCLQALHEATWVPVCPEQLGGLPTPRARADIVGGDGEDVLSGTARVVTEKGNDVTACFIRGAEQVLTVALAQSVDAVFLKARSPSCGLDAGVTAALLKRHGFNLREF